MTAPPEEVTLRDHDVTLLIDGDSIAFTAASAAQQNLEDEWGFVQPFARRAEGEAIVDNMLFTLSERLHATHVRIALTDPVDNWRKGVWPGYKGNRTSSVRPLLLTILKDYLREKHKAFHWPGLEADDVLGILNTEPQGYGGKRILVGADKDYLTIPGFYHRLRDTDSRGQLVVKEVTAWEAQRFHLYQTLAGDAVDGYRGCPNLGKTRASALLDAPVLLTPRPGVVTRGPNKGNATMYWDGEPTRDLWAMVVSHYRKAYHGQFGVDPEAEALVSARLAYILHHEDYDRATQEIRLWTPAKIKTV